MFKFKLEFLVLSLILCEISARQFRIPQPDVRRHKREADTPQLAEKIRVARDPDCLIKTAHTHEPNGQVRLAQQPNVQVRNAQKLNEQVENAQKLDEQVRYAQKLDEEVRNAQNLDEQVRNAQKLDEQVETEQAQPNIIALEQPDGRIVAVEHLPSGKFRTSGLIDQLSEGIAHGLSSGLSTGISSGITNSVYALPDAIAGTLNNLKNPNYGSSYSQVGHISEGYAPVSHISEGISSPSTGPYPAASYGSFSSGPPSYSSFSSGPVYSESYNSYSSPVHSSSYGSFSSSPVQSATYGSFSSSSPVYSAPSHVHTSYVKQKPFHWDCKLVPASYGNKLVFKDASEGGMQEQVESLSQLIQDGDYSVRSSNEPMGDVHSLRMNSQPMGMIENLRTSNQPMEFIDMSPRMMNSPMMRMNSQPMRVMEKMNTQSMGIMIDPKMNIQPMVVMEKMSQPMEMIDSPKAQPMMGFYRPSTMEMANQPMAVMEKMNNQPMVVMEKMNNQPMGFVDMSKSPPTIAFYRPNMETPENQLNESMLRDLEKQKNLALLEEMNMTIPPLGMVDPSKLVPAQATPTGNVMIMLVPVMDRNQMPSQPSQSHVQSGNTMSSAPKPKATEDTDERENFIEQNGEN